MQDLSKTDLKEKAKSEIGKTLLGLLVPKDVTDVPMNQQEQYKEELEKQVERVFKFLGY